MTETFPPRLDFGLLRRAFDTSDPHGEAALNALLYGAAALMASAVILVTTSPALVGVVLSFVPWLVLAVAGWLWIAPALRYHAEMDARRQDAAFQRRSIAADILLDDSTTPEQRRRAARVLLDGDDAAS